MCCLAATLFFANHQIVIGLSPPALFCRGLSPDENLPCFLQNSQIFVGLSPRALFCRGLRTFSPTKTCHFRANTNVLNKLSTYVIRKVLNCA